jgi:exopolysaccharide biosynthesis polyprenyl glycosylphosphotransferase
MTSAAHDQGVQPPGTFSVGAAVPQQRRRGADVPIPPGTPERLPWSWLSVFGVRPLLVGLDVLAVFIGVTGVDVLGLEVGLDSPTKKTAAFGVILLVLVWNAGLYRSRLSLSVLDDVPRLAGRWLAAVALAVLGQVLWSKAVWKDYLVDWRFLWGAMAIGGFVVLLRALGYGLVRRMRRAGWVSHPTLILGAGRVGNQVGEILRAHRQYGLEPIGFVDDDPSVTDEHALLPLLGGLKDLARVLRAYSVRDVVIAFSAVKESEMVAVIRACDRLRCELFVVPRLFELQHVHEDMDNAWGLPLVRLRRATYRSRAWHIKRLVDVLVSGTLVLIMLPALAVVALVVRIDGGPGILFRQERVGVDGRNFDVLKFRSLKPVDETESATTWNVSHDARLSSIGRFLRKSSLDELPQLFNILRGDMSLVGPRPERPHFVDQFRAAYPSYEARHRVPSGLTGWAQVHGLRGDTSIADRARFDNYYIENWSLWLDVKIVLRTFASVIRADGS